MNFKDRWAENEAGEQFLFTVEMQRTLSEAGLPVEPGSLARLPAGALVPARAERPSAAYQERDRGPRYEREARYERPEPQRDREPRYRSQPELEEGEREEIVGPATIQIDPQTGKYIGRVKWYNTKKGYGFIVRGGGEEIFFHKTGSVGDPTDLADGQWVLYDVEDTKKGPEATDVEPYEGEIPE
jgi:cold shock protein